MLRVPTMRYHCFDSTDQVHYHPTREQTSRLACAFGHRPDGKNRGDATLGLPHSHIIYGKGCLYFEQMALVVQPNGLAYQ